MKTYKHIFFDLDHTLWDYESNAMEALTEIHERHQLIAKNITLDKFILVYKLVNAELWRSYNSGKVTKDELRELRFYRTLGNFGFKEPLLANDLEDDFMEICPKKPHVLPNSFELLDYLKPKYELHIITNGFKGSTQFKMSNSGLMPYFKEIITSECIGITKPRAEIFEYSLQQAGASKEESVMIGDNLDTDIKGAKNAGLDHIYFNPSERKHKINDLKEVKDLIELKQYL